MDAGFDLRETSAFLFAVTESRKKIESELPAENRFRKFLEGQQTGSLPLKFINTLRADFGCRDKDLGDRGLERQPRGQPHQQAAQDDGGGMSRNKMTGGGCGGGFCGGGACGLG